MQIRILFFGELKPKGVPFTRQHIDRLEKAGRFPRHIKVGKNTNGWIESEVDQYIINRIKERDQALMPEAA